MTVVFLLASARSGGNSEQLARVAAESLPADLPQTWITLRDHPLEPFQDLRHTPGGYPPAVGNAARLLEHTLDCDHLVFVTPVYWYSVPAALKLYLDHWSHWMRIEGLDFRERMQTKTAWAISCSAGAAADAQPMFRTLQLCAKYLSMTWGGHVLGNGTAPGDVLHDTTALATAKNLFRLLHSN